MKKLFLTLGVLTCSTLIFAQSALKANTDWLTTHLNKLVIDDDDKQLNVNGNKSKPVFSFAGNKMLMNLSAKDKDFSMGFNISWSLKDVRKVSYKKEKDGNYELFFGLINCPNLENQGRKEYNSSVFYCFGKNKIRKTTIYVKFEHFRGFILV